MKKLLLLAFITMFFSACEKDSVEPTGVNDIILKSASDKPEKVKIWHLTSDGNYILIEVAQSAVDAHLSHGDIMYCEPDYYQGFEDDATGWMDGNSGWYGSVTRVEATSLLPASFGSWYALFEDGVTEDGGVTGPFTRFDGYQSIFPDNGWSAEIDIYLDPAWAVGSGFDYSVATSRISGAHLRDFIFHVTKDESTGKLLVAGSNNTNFAVRQDLENINNYEITSAGWYTFQHKFYNAEGTLAVDLNLLDANGSILFTETRNSSVDVIPDEVGGNRYGWFTFINVDGGIAVDETELYRGCEGNTVM
ncbi:hypothetical protein [Maribellus mangrovi]|uniref:hypothetical protein n=1 Tax=Maribellus mangrovi TaxID=3133146 RepID=UPI0030EF1B6B